MLRLKVVKFEPVSVELKPGINACMSTDWVLGPGISSLSSGRGRSDTVEDKSPYNEIRFCRRERFT